MSLKPKPGKGPRASSGAGRPSAMVGNKNDQVLRQQLIQARAELADVQEELREKHNLYLQALGQRDAGDQKLAGAKETLARFEARVAAGIAAGTAKTKEELERVKKDNSDLIKKLEAAQSEIMKEKTKVADGRKDLMEARQKNNFGGNQPAFDLGGGQDSNKITQAKSLIATKDKELLDLKGRVNYLQDQIEDFMAENKALRRLAGVPANYGIDRAQVKLLDRDKIDDYKKLIRVLQDDNYRLEAERAKLKQQLKLQVVSLSGNVAKVDNGDQNMSGVDAVEAFRLQKENEELKVQMETLEKKGFNFIREQVEGLFKDMQGGAGGGLSTEQFDKIRQDYSELKVKLDNLGNMQAVAPPLTTQRSADRAKSSVPDPTPRGQSMNNQSIGYQPSHQSSQFLQPPVPRFNGDQTISQGYSHKFDANLNVTGRNGEERSLGAKMTKQELYDNAFLQLQLQEGFETISRKDEALKVQKREIDTLYNRIKKYLLMQDHLYKGFVDMEEDHTKRVQGLQKEAEGAREQLAEALNREKLQKNLLASQNPSSGDSKQEQLIELTKQNSFLEINYSRATRQLQALKDREALSKRRLDDMETEMSDMQVSCMRRINELKEWKRNASFQLKTLYEQLRVAIPVAEYEAAFKEVEIYKQRNGDLMVRNKEYAEKISQVQRDLRKQSDDARASRELTELKNDLEKELQSVRSRLEQLDPQFKWENQIFNRIVTKLKRTRVSVLRAFELFDTSGDGVLQRGEFTDALEKLGLGDLAQNEIEAVLRSVDLDGDGQINYNEFARKLARYGLRQLTEEETLAYKIIDTMRKLGMKPEELFRYMNKEGDGILTRKDLREFLVNLKMQEVGKEQTEKFIDYFYKDAKGGIDGRAFLAIFGKYQRQMDQDEKPVGSIHDQRRRVKLSPKLIQMKKNIFEEIDFACRKADIQMRKVFNKVDSDGSGALELREFKLMLQNMRVDLGDESSAQQIFTSMDFDSRGKVTWDQFNEDVKKYLKKSIHELEEEERLINLDDANEEPVISTGGGGRLGSTSGGGVSQFKELEYQRRIASLEDKVKQAYIHLRNENSLRNQVEESLKRTERHHDALREQFDATRDEYFKLQQKVKEQKALLDQSILADDATNFRKQNIGLRNQLEETRSALISYKNMQNVTTEQVKSLKLLHERKKDEHKTLEATLRDIESQNFDHQQISKLHYVVMLSRWQEAAVNKKYEMKHNECKELRSEVQAVQDLFEEKELEVADAEAARAKMSQQMLHLKQELQSANNMFLTIQHGEEFNRVINILTDERAQLEEEYLRARADCNSALNMLDEAKIRAEEKGKLLHDLQYNKPSELSDKLIGMGETLQKLSIATRKAERRAQELEERENWLEQRLQNRTSETTELEQTVAKLEKDLHVKEERWRLRENERMRLYHNRKLDQSQDDAQPNLAAKYRDKSKTVAGRGMSNAGRQQTESYQGGAEGTGAREGQLMDRVNQLQRENQQYKEDLDHKMQVLRERDSYLEQDQFLQGGDTGVNEALADQRIKFQKEHERENTEMADAAYQTIQTLNEMLQQKKKQISTKDEQIKSLREQMGQQRSVDQEEIRKLREQASGIGQSALAKIHRLASTQEAAPVMQDRTESVQNLQKNNREMAAAQGQMDQLRREIEQMQDKREQVVSQLTAERSANQRLKQEHEEEVRELERKVTFAQEKRKHLANERAAKNDKLIAGFHNEMTQYQKEIAQLEDSNKGLQLRLTMAAESRGSAGVSVGKGALKMGDDGSLQQRVAELQSAVKKKEQELVTLKEKQIKATDEKKGNNAKLTELTRKMEEEKTKVKEYLKSKMEAQDSLRNARQAAESERLHKEKYKLDLDKLIAEKQGGGSGGLTYSDMQAKLRELESDVYILESQKKTVLVHNPSTGTFEYLGEPLPLNRDQDLSNIEEVTNAMTKWLQRPSNDRLSVKQVFESLDFQSRGELSQKNFESALSRLGIRTATSEMRSLQEVLQTNPGFLRFHSLVRELQGVPQQDFMNSSIKKLSGVALGRDLSAAAFAELIDAKNIVAMDFNTFKEAMTMCKAPDFSFDTSEVTSIFSNITKAERLQGIKMNINDLVAKVFSGVKASLIDQVRSALERAGFDMNSLFAKYDSNKDGFLSHQELSEALNSPTVDVRIGSNMSTVLMSQVLDPPQPGKKKGGSGKISFGVLKFYFESFGPMGVDGTMHITKQVDQIDSSVGAGKSSQPVVQSNLTSDLLQTGKRASRKLLAQCHNNIIEIVGKLDHHEEGIVNKEELRQAITDQKVSDLERDELNALLKCCDPGQKGYISTSKFIERLYGWAGESEGEVILRRLHKNLSRMDINLKNELMRYDTTGSGKLDKPTFKRALKQLAIALADLEIQKLINEQSEGQPAKKGVAETIDVRRFALSVVEAGKAKQLPNYVLQGPKGSSSLGGKKAGGSGNAMAGFDAEKKYKKNLEALKQEIEEKNREVDGLGSQIQDCHDRYNKLDREKKDLEARLVDKNSKPPKETANQSLAFSQAQELMQLRDQLFYQQDENTKLRRTIEVTFKAELNRLSIEKEQLESKVGDTLDEKVRLQNQIQNLIGKTMDGLEKREELELSRQLRINQLELQLDDSETSKAEIQDQLFKAEEKLLDLKFEKETYDLQYARLQKRIQELDQYKQSSSSLSAALKAHEQAETKEVDEIVGLSAKDGKKKKDTVRVRASGNKTVGELEVLVESLKRVIDKLRNEKEILQKENTSYAGHTGKVASEKVLKQKISNLEQLVHSHEMKEIDVGAKDDTIKKLIGANKQLREDLGREGDRYALLEGRYKEILMKYTTVAKENAKKEDLIFGMTTGGNLNRYGSYLGDKS